MYYAHCYLQQCFTYHQIIPGVRFQPICKRIKMRTKGKLVGTNIHRPKQGLPCSGSIQLVKHGLGMLPFLDKARIRTRTIGQKTVWIFISLKFSKQQLIIGLSNHKRKEERTTIEIFIRIKHRQEQTGNQLKGVQCPKKDLSLKIENRTNGC